MKQAAIAVALAVLVIAGFATAQSGTPVIAHQGNPGQYGPWPVSVSGPVYVVTDGGFGGGGGGGATSTVCATPTNKLTAVGVAAGNTPSTQLASRTQITFCNSLQNTGNPTVKCRLDGVAPVMAAGNIGDVLGVGDCITYNIAAATVPQCIADAANTYVTTLECT